MPFNLLKMTDTQLLDLHKDSLTEDAFLLQKDIENELSDRGWRRTFVDWWNEYHTDGFWRVPGGIDLTDLMTDKESKQYEKIDAELSILTGFISNLKDLIPGKILDHLVKAEIELRLLIQKLKEKDQ